MTSATQIGYIERTMHLTGDPLATMARLASAGLHASYVVYENAGQWSFASGALAEVLLDQREARLRQARPTVLPWDGAPLTQVQRLLEQISVADWRAYGWATFELAYAKDGDRTNIGPQRLLHLIVPHTEVRIDQGQAQIRSADRDTLERVVAVLGGDARTHCGRTSPLDVRKQGAAAYRRKVALAVREIRARRLQKVIFSRVVPVLDEIDFVETYVAGRRGNNPARSFLLRLGGIEAAGFSPEIVVHVDGNGRVTSQPLAGTRGLTNDPAENARLRSELLADAKEIYEHAVSVKAACDELATVCVPGSMNVEEFMTVKERGSVQHLASRVSGQLIPGYNAWDAFGAVFPAVTASGVPKDAACASIRSHESQARGIYSGAVLTVDHAGVMDAALVLRAVYRQNGATWLQAGAGIVDQSSPAREFEETCEKLDSVARFLVSATSTRGSQSRGVTHA